MKQILLAVLVSTLSYGMDIPSKEYALKPAQGKVGFLAVGRPSALKIRGEGEGPTGAVTVSDKKLVSGRFEFQLDSLKTGIDMRDSHMKEKYLQTKEHPKAEFSIENLDLAKLTEVKDLEVPGKLKLHGQVQDVVAKVSLEKSDSDLNLKATFAIVLGKYGIDIPKYLGITVAEDVQVEVESKIATK